LREYCQTRCTDVSKVALQQVEHQPSFKVPESSLARVVPSLEETTAVQRSWVQIEEFGTARFGEMLFGELFRQDPGTMAFFTPEICDRYWDWTIDVKHATASKPPVAPQLYAKVASLIGGAVIGLHNTPCLVQALVRLGARHVTYGVKMGHFSTLSKALVETLRTCLGEGFTSDVALAWSVVFNFITATMTQGMQAASTPTLAKSPNEENESSNANPESTAGVARVWCVSEAPALSQNP